MKRTPLRRKQPPKPSVELYEDCHGVRFCEIRSHLPARVKDWPKLRIVRDSEVLRIFRMLVGGGSCPLCKRNYWQFCREEIHHICGGAARSDEFCNLLSVCSDCHAEIQSDVRQTARVWLAKWTVDRQHTNWVRLVRLAGKWPGFDLGEE
jgi:hypothetical protein